MRARVVVPSFRAKDSLRSLVGANASETLECVSLLSKELFCQRQEDDDEEQGLENE